MCLVVTIASCSFRIIHFELGFVNGSRNYFPTSQNPFSLVFVCTFRTEFTQFCDILASLIHAGGVWGLNDCRLDQTEAGIQRSLNSVFF